MGKHSSGQQNYSIAKGPLIAVVVVLLLIGAIVLWQNLKSDTEASHEASSSQCSKGDLVLIVTADPAVVGQAQKLVRDYGETNPVVKDHCVRPQISIEGSQEVLDALGRENTHGVAVSPGVWIPADRDFIDRAGQQQRVAVEAPQVWLEPTAIGVAVPQDQAPALAKSTWQQLADKKVATPGGSDAALSSMVNDVLGGGANAATQRAGLGAEFTANSLLPQLADGTTGADAVAATQPMLDVAGTNLSLVVPENSPQLNAPIVAFGSGGPISEITARAGAEFIKFAKDSDLTNTDDHDSTLTDSARELLPVLSGIKTDPNALPDPNAPRADGTPAAAGGPGSTLLLIDASDDVNIPALAKTVAPLVPQAVSQENHRVAVWNYSSPQTSAATHPVRSNVLFVPGTNGVDESVATLNEIGSVGKPWLWQSVALTYDYAVGLYAEDMPNRVILITTGRDESGDDVQQALAEIQEQVSTEAPVAIEVVALPGAQVSPELEKLAEITGGNVYTAENYEDSLATAVANAIGI